MNNNRGTDRLNISIMVNYTKNKEEISYNFCRDLSEGGLFIDTMHPLSIGEELELTIVFPHNNSPFTSNATVCWIRKKAIGINQPAGMGLQFVGLNEKQVTQLKKYINHYQSKK